MASLVDLYKNYYREQTPQSIEMLFGQMLEYDYLNYEKDMKKIVAMHSQTRCRGEKTRLYTNGSTRGRARVYDFGPNFGMWASKIEPFLRDMNNGKTIFLSSRLGCGTAPKTIAISPCGSNKKHFETNGNLLERSQIEELFSFVEGLRKEGFEVNFSSFPDVWNMLLSNPVFESMCLDPRHKIKSLVNNDFEMMIKTDKIYIRDQMINWVSGLNFWDCEMGTRHFLPTFFLGSTCLNLLNTVKTHDGSDSAKINQENVSMCACGRPYIPMDVRFHVHNQIVDARGKPMDMSRIGKIVKGRYASIQIHQRTSGEVSIVHAPMDDRCHEDLARIRNLFGGLETKDQINRYFEVGFKRYCFWRSEAENSKRFELN